MSERITQERIDQAVQAADIARAKYQAACRAYEDIGRLLDVCREASEAADQARNEILAAAVEQLAEQATAVPSDEPIPTPV